MKTNRLVQIYDVIDWAGVHYVILVYENDHIITLDDKEMAAISKDALELKNKYTGHMPWNVFYSDDESVDLIDTVKESELISYLKFLHTIS